MPIFIYNSLTRKKEELLPLKPPKINIYTCGVTVYDESHIGHARSLYIFDVIRRYLVFRGFRVRFVRNITDIDDKIINRAKELKADWKQLTQKYISRYYEDLKILGIKRADYEPKATENIKEMIKHIKGLIDKGYAYTTDSGVYFNVRKFRDYGKLSGQGIDQMRSGCRIEPDENKQDPLDFALWKSSQPGEPSWPSPWGKGRPGWHIECSAMSMKYLKAKTLDIHAGGRDLIFPHHENEIAQAESLTAKAFAKYWIHHGLLSINGQKMAKSLGNFVTIKDFIAKYKDADILKLFFLSTHYSHPIDYTQEKIEEAKRALEGIAILLGNINRKLPAIRFGRSIKKVDALAEIKDEFIKAMDDDFNTPRGLASIFDLVNVTNKNIGDLDFISKARELLYALTKIFSLDVRKRVACKDLPVRITVVRQDGKLLEKSVEELISERNAARKKNDFRQADEIRRLLEEKGIILEDTKDGTVWRRRI